MCDYKNGKIYQLVCYETGETYIGSTAMSLEDRLKGHRSKTGNKCCSKQIIDRNNYYIELLETYPCNNEFELKRKEGEYQKSMKCINHNIAGRTDAEYRQDNKEKLAKYNKKYLENHLGFMKNYRLVNKEKLTKNALIYRENNKEAIKARESKVVVCECGIKSTHNHLARHKLTKLHIDLINLETIKPPIGDVVVCECGISCTKGHLARHKTSKKHIDLMTNLS